MKRVVPRHLAKLRKLEGEICIAPRRLLDRERSLSSSPFARYDVRAKRIARVCLTAPLVATPGS
jgi:hypothetical protein